MVQMLISKILLVKRHSKGLPHMVILLKWFQKRKFSRKSYVFLRTSWNGWIVDKTWCKCKRRARCWENGFASCFKKWYSLVLNKFELNSFDDFYGLPLGYEKIVDSLIRNGANINHENGYGKTALSKAVEKGKLIMWIL